MTELTDTLYQEAAALSWIDWTATVTALIYVILAARSNIWCWFWGIISCSLWAYASFAFYDLYLDALLQVFYVVMAVVGWYEWRRGGPSGEQAPILKLAAREHVWILLGGGLLAFLFGSFFEAYTPAAATYWDAGTTVFSVIATFLLVRRILDNWTYWIVVDAVYVGLYASRGAYLFALLMVAYTVIAGVALWKWGRDFRGEGF